MCISSKMLLNNLNFCLLKSATKLYVPSDKLENYSSDTIHRDRRRFYRFLKGTMILIFDFSFMLV